MDISPAQARICKNSSPQQQARLPADPFRRRPQFLKGPVLDLADAFLADAEQMADLPQAVGAVAGQAKAKIEHLAFARPQVLHEEVESFLTFGVGPERGAFVVGHRFGELEVAVVVEDGVERYRGTCGGLQMGEVFEAGAGAGGQFLRAGQVLAAVSEGFGFLLQKAQFLQVVRRQADQMALAGHGDLQASAGSTRWRTLPGGCRG